MAAEWETRGDSGVEAIEADSGVAADAYDIDPDIENYANGRTPDTPYGSHDSPDDPGDRDGHVSDEQHYGNEHPGDGYADARDEAGQLEYTGIAADLADEWGDTDPDAENYAGLDGPGLQHSPHEDQLEADRDVLAASQLDQAEPSAVDTGERLSPEQQRIHALEAENADAKHRIADLEEKNSDANLRIADLKAELKAVKDEHATRLDRIEQLLASGDRSDRDASTQEHRADQPSATRDPDAKSPTIADRKGNRQSSDAKREEDTRWRRAVSSENVGIAGTFVGAADTVAQFAMHATPEGVVGLGAMVLGLASVGLAKAEKHRKENHDRPDQRQGGEGAA
jgi:hypothetical protein